MAVMDRQAVSVSLVLAVPAGFVAGCAGLDYRSPVGASAALEPAQAYLCGRFRRLGSDTPLSMERPLSLELTNVGTNESVNIKFNGPGTDVYAIAVAPGEYRFTHLLMGQRPLAFEDRVRRTVVSLPVPQRTSFAVQARRAYYVGDYVAAVSIDREYYVVATRTTWKWKLDEASLKYDETTRELTRMYPAFETVDLAPARARP